MPEHGQESKPEKTRKASVQETIRKTSFDIEDDDDLPF